MDKENMVYTYFPGFQQLPVPCSNSTKNLKTSPEIPEKHLLLFYFQFLFEVIIESRWQKISLGHLGFDLQLFSGVKPHHSCRVLSGTE